MSIPATALRCAAALSSSPDTRRAFAEVLDEACGRLDGPCDLAMLFASAHHQPQLDSLGPLVAARLETDAVLGCTGESIVCGDQEIEQQPAIALWLARLPEATVVPMHLEFAETHEGGIFTGWPSDLPSPLPAGATLFLLGDPFSFPADQLIARINEDHPGLPVLGGMASGGAGPRQNRLLIDGGWHDHGAVAALVYGGPRIRSVVSQGCRPIGRPFVVTKAEANVILELGGMPALARLQEVFGGLTAAEQQLVRSGLHVGRVLSEYQEHFSRGDFLVRNVIGADPNTGAIAIGDYVRPGQTVQFHIRDAATADEDLRALLAAATADSGEASTSPPAGALLFTCNGRGTRLFAEPNHDAACLRDCLGDIPVAGFFAQGELGPVGGKNFLHGFTASVALFAVS
jgi:small ligand-binding sensory domain FIST